MTATIGPATPAEIEPVAAIEREVFPDPWSADSFRALPGDPRVFFACARGAGSEVLGYVVAIFAADEGEIANLAVAPTDQRHGVGGALLDATIAEAERRVCRALYLEVRDSNRAAQRLYASRGFTQVGRRRRYYQHPVEDALLLRLRLDRAFK